MNHPVNLEIPALLLDKLSAESVVIMTATITQIAHSRRKKVVRKIQVTLTVPEFLVLSASTAVVARLIQTGKMKELIQSCDDEMLLAGVDAMTTFPFDSFESVCEKFVSLTESLANETDPS